MVATARRSCGSWPARCLAVVALSFGSPAWAQRAPPAEPECARIAADPAALLQAGEPGGASPAELERAGEQAWKRGDFALAAACWLDRARSLAGTDADAEIASLLRSGHALLAAGHGAHAREAFEQASQRAKQTSDIRSGTRALAGLGESYRALGDQKLAEEKLGAALERARTAGDAPLVASIQNERGNLLQAAGRSAEALAAYEESEAQARATGDTSLALRAAANGLQVAVASLDAGGLDALVKRIDAQVVAAGALSGGEEKARLLTHLGRTLEQLEQRRPELRARTRPRAAAAYSAAAEAAGAAGAERSRSYALGYLAQIYGASGRHAEALELNRRAVLAAELADAPDALYRWHWQAGRLHRAMADSDAAIDSYRQATRELARLRAQTGFDARGVGDSFQRSVKPISDELVDLLLARAAQTEDADARQALLIESRDTLEEIKAGELRDYFQDECVDAQRKASVESVPGSVIVYPIILADRLELIVSDQSGLRRFASPVGRERFEAEVHAFRRLLEKHVTNEYRVPARQLYEWLIRPLEGVLDGAQVDALVFVPGGALRTIPIGALINPDTGEYLIERYPIAVTPGLTLTDPTRIDHEQVKILTAGLTEARQGYAALPHVGQELEATRRVFEGTSLLDAEFVVPALQDQLERTQFGIVHIASHGEFAANFEDSFVLTYDDKLPVDRLAELVGLSRFRSQPLQLITLSACETAAGDDRAALGIAGVAVRAGAHSALATLWSINDDVSAELISEFYTALGDPAFSRASALQRAQLKVLRTHRYRHPAYWAPFLLISSWL